MQSVCAKYVCSSLCLFVLLNTCLVVGPVRVLASVVVSVVVCVSDCALACVFFMCVCACVCSFD